MTDTHIASPAGESIPAAPFKFVLSSIGLLSVIDPWRDEVLDRLDVLLAYCAEHECGLVQAEESLGVQLDAQMNAVSIRLTVRDWYDTGAQQIVYMKDLLLLRDWENGTELQRFVWTIVCMLEPMAHITLKHDFDELTLLAEAAEHCKAAASFASQRGFLKAAIEALDAAASLCFHANLPSHYELSAEALRLARQDPDPDCDQVARLALRHAVSVYESAKHHRTTWIEALDSFEDVLRNLPAGKDAQKECLAGIIAAARTKELHALRAWIAMMVTDAPQEIADNIKGLHVYVPLVFEDSPQAFMIHLHEMAKIVQIAEDLRVKMLGEIVDHKARADWATWSLRHDAFRSAIPHGNSFLREQDLQQLILVLNHELTHVLSMSSDVGWAIIAMRAALTEVELELWGHGVRGDVAAVIAGIKQGLAPLDGNDVMKLALVERELELMLKLRVLQDVWAPWFEGIAIAAEASNPIDDPEVFHPALQALIGMIDGAVKPEEQDTEATIAAKTADYFHQIEKLYGEAVATQGPARQRSYLTPPDAMNYLPGIITVRSVVAGWRKTLGIPLAGTLASRILLHVTRFGTKEFVPDLSLQLDDFRKHAMLLHLNWIRWVAGLRSDQLEAVLDINGEKNPGMLARWRDGELFTFSRDDDTEIETELDIQLQKLALQAYTSLASPNSPTERVSGANEECRAVLMVVGDILAKKKPHANLVRFFNDHYQRILRALPVGAVDVPFWLLPHAKGFYVMIRTTEKHREHGGSDYNGMLRFGLLPPEFSALEDEVRRLQHSRMRITRFIDLMTGGVIEGRGFGRNVLVFEYGEWKYMLPAGLLIGSESIDDSLRSDIEARLHSSTLAELDMRFLSNGAANAQRARAWLDGIDEWRWSDGERISIEAWADHVRALADELEHPTIRSAREAVGAELLRFVLGSDMPAEQAMKEGLRPLRSDDEGSSAEASRLLFAVGSKPVPKAQAPEANHWQRLFTVSDTFVDVVPPAGVFNDGEKPCRSL